MVLPVPTLARKTLGSNGVMRLLFMLPFMLAEVADIHDVSRQNNVFRGAGKLLRVEIHGTVTTRVGELREPSKARACRFPA
jgi:hypothetical protein